MRYGISPPRDQRQRAGTLVRRCSLHAGRALCSSRNDTPSHERQIFVADDAWIAPKLIDDPLVDLVTDPALGEQVPGLSSLKRPVAHTEVLHREVDPRLAKHFHIVHGLLAKRHATPLLTEMKGNDAVATSFIYYNTFLSFMLDLQRCYTEHMQKIATRVFIYASLVFGAAGVIMVLAGWEPDERNTGLALVVTKLFITSIFVILPAFALSVAGKYLNSK